MNVKIPLATKKLMQKTANTINQAERPPSFTASPILCNLISSFSNKLDLFLSSEVTSSVRAEEVVEVMDFVPPKTVFVESEDRISLEEVLLSFRAEAEDNILDDI